jgi:vancomycin resistance protein YoaR
MFFRIFSANILTGVLVAASTFAYAQEGGFGELASFTTKYNAGVVNRTHNIALASRKLDGIVLFPEEEFSFNDSLGPPSKEHGYRIARTLFRGHYTKGYGGGICQLGSTLHAAALEAGLTVTERHEHSRPVPYIKNGLDAATSYGGKDLKFVNDFGFPVKFNIKCGKGKLTVSIVAYND